MILGEGRGQGKMGTDASQNLGKEEKKGRIQGRIWAKNNKNDSLQAHQAGRVHI
jgi:hypothetical protein